MVITIHKEGKDEGYQKCSNYYFKVNTYLPYILTPLFGAFIGYITNWIAIKMLFRPHRAHYLFGKQLPFTPGIIPKEKGCIAASIGEAISQNLMNEEVIRHTLLSEDMLSKVGAAFDNGVDKLRHEDKSLHEWLTGLISKEEVESVEAQVKEEITKTVAENLVSANLGQKIAHMAVNHAIEKMKNGLLGLFHVDKLLGNLRISAEELLAKNIDEMLDANAAEMVTEMVDSCIVNLTSSSVSSLLANKDEQIASARNTVLNMYKQTVELHLPAMLASLNIKRIIEDRINSMDVMEVERLIFEVMDKELTAIIRLGILLGFIMGCLNCLFL